jgi:hypothetical protein
MNFIKIKHYYIPKNNIDYFMADNYDTIIIYTKDNKEINRTVS